MGGQADAFRIPAVAPGVERLEAAAGLMGDIYDKLLERLAMEPCVAKRGQDTQELMEAPNKLRRGMAPR